MARSSRQPAFLPVLINLTTTKPFSKETRHQLVKSIFPTPSSLLKELFVVKVPFTFAYKQDGKSPNILGSKKVRDVYKDNKETESNRSY